MPRSIVRRQRRSVALAVAILLGATAPLPAQPPCLDFAGLLQPGDGLELTVDDATWIQLEVRFDRVYRFTVSAVPGTTVELWSLDFDEGDQCYVREDMLVSNELSEATAAFDWTDPSVVGAALRVALPDGTGPSAVVLELEEVAAPPEEGVLVVPAVAHTNGARGELFQTDLVVFNPLGVAVPATLVFVPTGGGAEERVDIEVEAHEMVAFDDLVTSVFGLDDGVGALRVEYPSFRTVKAISRTYALTESGTYGQFIAALPFADAASLGFGGAVRVLPHLAKTDDFRSNVGFVEVLGLEAVFDLAMVDDEGNELARREIVLPPLGHRQINDVFDFLGVDGRDNVAIRIEMASHGRILAYASVVDNHTSDPIFVPGLIAGPPNIFFGDDNEYLSIAAAASNRGAHGTRWRTDLRVFPMPGQEGPLQVTFVPNDGSEPAVATFEFAGPGPLAVDDVVAALGVSGVGKLRLRSPEGTILATSRTYTTSDEGTYGQFIPAEWLFVDLDRAVVLGLRGTADYRSNAGLVNPGDDPVEAELRLVSAAGELLASRTESLAPGEGRQINDVFRAFGLTGCDLCRLEYETVGDDLYVWGSVVDNRSGDAIFVPPIPY